jgi:hypothetical protein
MRSALLLLAGIVVGVAGYAAYRGDFASQGIAPQLAAEKPSEKPTPAVSAPAPLPELPVSLTFQENRTGRGYVVQVHNTSQKHLAVLIELKNPTFEQETTASLQLGPGELREIGEAQGWTFVSGETISVRQEGYQAASLTIP